MTSSVPATSQTAESRSSWRPGRSLYAPALALAGVGLWSTNALAGNTALTSLPLSVVIAVQFVTATAGLGLFKLITTRRGARADVSTDPLTRADWLAAAAVGVIGLAGTMTLQYVAFANAPIVEANIVAYAWPIIAAGYLAATLRTTHAMIGLALAVVGFVGVILIMTGHSGTSGGGASSIGYTAAVVSAICMAYYTLGSGWLRVPTIDLMLIGTAFGSVGSVAFVAITQPAMTWSVNILAAAYVGIGPVATGYLLWSMGMAASRARLAPLGYATPLLSTCVLLLSGQQFGHSTLIGALIVLVCTIGVLIADRVSGGSHL